MMTIEPPFSFTHSLQQVVPITDEQSANFFKYFTLFELKADEYFVRQGQVCNRIGFIESGMIRHYYTNDQEDVTRWMSLDGEFVTALSSFIRSTPCNHYLQAISACKLWVIDGAIWWEQYHQHEILRTFWVKMMEYTVIGFEERVYQQLANDAEQRYLYFMKHFPRFLEKVPQKYIASMIGIKPESLSRLRSKLAQKPIS
ncbi:MAG: Crp/Fnr family transcriptional regulator [Cyclobacteriaceae bacterium]|nr:Crp/Fnr family transcriptional regulator [Cyclobacteriaceae bacterium]